MTELKKPTKKNQVDAIFEALTSSKSLEEIITSKKYEPFKISKSQLKFLIHNLDFVALDRISDLTDDALLKVKKNLGKRFTDLVSFEDAQAVMNRIGGEYKRLTGKVSGRVKKKSE